MNHNQSSSLPSPSVSRLQDEFRSDEDQEDSKSPLRASPESDYQRKRRQRSISTPDHTSAWPQHADNSFEDHAINGRPRIPGGRDHRTSSSSNNTSDGIAGSSKGPHEDSLTVRRREANRLAAQRFRSRKKGYQDSLEEKVRQLEEDKELLIRRLTDVSGPPPPDRRGSNHWQEDRANPRENNRSGSIRASQPLSPDHPDVAVDADVRIASLESANRRLQDELRRVNDEKDKLREELDHWRRWQRDQLDAAWNMETARRDAHRLSPRQFPPPGFDTNGIASHSLPPSSQRSSAPSSYGPPAPFPPSMTSSSISMPSLSPPDSRPQVSPGLRLPPIRLPPIQTSLNSLERSSPITAHSQYLPRPVVLDSRARGVLPPPSARSPGTGEDRQQ